MRGIVDSNLNGLPAGRSFRTSRARCSGDRTFPNWDGAVQPRKIVVLNADEFINENAGGSMGGGAIVQNKYARAKQFVQYQLRVHFRR